MVREVHGFLEEGFDFDRILDCERALVEGIAAQAGGEDASQVCFESLQGKLWL
jgi:hypothetical protein